LSTKLPLLLDECLPGPLADEIRRSKPGVSRLVVVDANHELGNCGTSDEALVHHATEEGLIFVTVESRLDERRFKICTNAGIIQILTKVRHPDTQYRCFLRFMTSGHRKLSKHAVVKIRDEHFELVDLLEGKERTRTFSYDPPALPRPKRRQTRGAKKPGR
jgi:hypothetical protein